MDRYGQFRALFRGWTALFLSPLRGLAPIGADTHGLRRGRYSFAASRLGVVVIACVLGISVARAQSGGTQGQSGTAQSQTPNQTQTSPSSQSSQDIPDAPSAVQPPAPKPAPQPETPPKPSQTPNPGQSSTDSSRQQGDQEKPALPPVPPVETIAPGSMPEASSQRSAPKNQINATDDLYKISVTTNFVQIPVMVKDKQGRRVDGLLPQDFTVLENGKPQKLSYFTSDPFQLSVAVLIDLGMADVSVQKVNQTYSALVGAFSPYDEVALYTYSSTVSRVTDFTGRPERLTATLDSLKLVRGHNNGPPVLGGPLGPQPPMVNGIPVGTSGPPPVYTPPKEAHVLNDAILRAALDLSKRDRTRRKVIFVISDGRELGSRASYNEVLHVLETQGIQVKAVVLDMGALPIYKQVEKLPHVFRHGYSDILPKYTNATGGGSVFTELSRNSIEQAYAQITSEARNQYTLGYVPKAIASSSAYRDIEVRVLGHGANLNIYTKAGYYPIPSAK
ncbi:MAG TPA: VWA domain-containing protein [Candidatus Sulfotelmatobacter sp.]|nr:VWA domain-containing protein [Candidatus Sulfotelmatobacter sp.]